MKKIAIAMSASALALALSQSAATAADLGSLKDDVIVTAPTPTWTGLYFGGGGGYGWNRSDNIYNDDIDFFDETNKESADGGLITTIFGYDRQVRDRIVLGVFADFDISDIERGSGSDALTITRSWAVGGRLGYLVTPRTMLFATGGYTEAHFRNEGWWDLASGDEGFSSRNFKGYFVGGGLETMLGHNFFLRGEVRWANFGDEVINIGDTYVDKEDPELFTTRLSLVYKLDRSGHGHESLKDSGEVEDHNFSVVTINGVDVAKDWWAVYSANYFALNGDWGRDGFVFRTIGQYAEYDYDLDGTAIEIDGEQRQADVMIGYQKIFQHFYATAYVGLEVRDEDLSPDDPDNDIRGTETGFKIAFDAATKSGSTHYVGIDSSYSTAFDTFYGQLRVGRNFGNLIVGPEASFYDDEQEGSQRLGAFFTRSFTISPTRVGEFTVNGGYQWVDDSDDGDSESGGTSGGEGGYIGSSLKLVF